MWLHYVAVRSLYSVFCKIFTVYLYRNTNGRNVFIETIFFNYFPDYRRQKFCVAIIVGGGNSLTASSRILSNSYDIVFFHYENSLRFYAVRDTVRSTRIRRRKRYF